jgi:signal transduction histidine kinase
MRKKLLEQLHNRLETLFSDVSAEPDGGERGRELARRASQRRELPTGWVWETDISGHYTWCSPEIERILGISPRELVGKPIYEAPMVGNGADQLQSTVASTQPISNFRLQAKAKSGRKYSLLLHALVRNDSAGRQVGYRGVAQVLDLDVPSSSRLTVSLPHLPDAVDATAPPPLLAAWGTVPGYEDDGQTLRPVQSAADDSRLQPTSDHGESLRVPISGPDSPVGVLEFDEPEDGSTWSAEDRELVEAVAQQLGSALQDMRSHQLTEQALEEMREADQLKSQFLANMSHELRTPLNSIIGFSRVILKGIDGPITDTQREDLNAIYNAGQHLLGLISDMLDISRIEAGKLDLTFGDVDLSEIINGVMTTAIGLVKDKPIELVTDVPDDLPHIRADSIRIRQVLLNLVSNASKFTEEGQIAVSARHIAKGERNDILVAVADTGIGIAPDNLEKLFEPFSQVDPSPTRKSGGTGLGLSIARHLVELHGGRIWVESTVDEGSTFAFTLPVEPPTLEDEDESETDGPGEDDAPASSEQG